MLKMLIYFGLGFNKHDFHCKPTLPILGLLYARRTVQSRFVVQINIRTKGFSSLEGITSASSTEESMSEDNSSKGTISRSDDPELQHQR